MNKSVINVTEHPIGNDSQQYNSNLVVMIYIHETSEGTDSRKIMTYRPQTQEERIKTSPSLHSALYYLNYTMHWDPNHPEASSCEAGVPSLS